MTKNESKQDWMKPAAMAIPKGGVDKDSAEQGRYGPIFPRTPACYGFSIVAKIIPGREEAFHEHARTIETAVTGEEDNAKRADGDQGHRSRRGAAGGGR